MSTSDRTLNQTQRAGRDTSQQQAARDIVNVNVTVVDAQSYLSHSREAVLARELGEQAVEVARERVTPFDAELVRVLAERGLLTAFADPAVQRTMNAARVEAGSTERDDDRQRLLELVAGRAASNARDVRASIDRAIAVVDLVDDAALRILTYDMGGIELVVPYWGLFSTLDHWESRLVHLDSDDLPSGTRWYEHLDTLGLIRFTTARVESFRTPRQWLGDLTSAYFHEGVPPERGGEIQERVVAMLGEDASQTPLPILEQELKPGFVRPMAKTRANQEVIMMDQGHTLEDANRVLDILEEYFPTDVDESTLTGPFLEELEKRPAAAAWSKHRASLPYAYSLTDVGRALVWAQLVRSGIVEVSLEDMLRS